MDKTQKKKWSKKYNYCQECGTSDRPHKGNGLCLSCYFRKPNQKNSIGVTVYLVNELETPFYKIGHASKINNRVTNIQTGNPHEVELFTSIWFPTKAEALNLERSLQICLAKYNVRAEWFSLSEEMATKIRESFDVQNNLQTTFALEAVAAMQC